MKKLNNKGFSLVELIIVIAIMVILVIAIAPQYLKFVNNSRISTDVQTAQAMATQIDVSVADGTYDATAVSTLASTTSSKLGGTWEITASATQGVSKITIEVSGTKYECYPNPDSTGTPKGVNNTTANGGLRQ